MATSVEAVGTLAARSVCAPGHPSIMSDVRISLLGTGTMGSGMARSLLRAGHTVTVWNRTRARAEPLADAGARVADAPTAAVAEAEAVVLMLYDAGSVLDVMDEVGGDGPADAVWVQSSTIGVDGTRRAAGWAAERGLAFVDAPVLGTRQPAENGELVVLAAAPPPLRDRVTPVFQAIGARTLWLSETPGDASALKLAINAWISAITAATGQSVALAEALGLDPRLFLEAIGGGPTDSPYAQVKGSAMITDRFAPQFTVDGVRKDVGLIIDAAGGAGVSTTLLDAVLGCFERASERGHGGEDMAAVVRAFPGVTS